ncbi:uncharacterized protein LOC143363208 isoform X2 [Halictus rubicundus]|uniref:uncharacterized protein LOC143363208 isoform X2 n=1 Tax=Halictus rubicundus TaxID=77578 RepID=UPI0040359F39
MFIPTFILIVLIFSCGKARCIIDGLCADSNNWEPFLYMSKDLDGSPNYDVTHWVRQLHLQQCAFVEIGEGFCALFVELRSIPSESEVLDNSGVGEFFLGICPCLILHSWTLCSSELSRRRKVDCTFVEATPYSNTSARVHRRLCDVTLLGDNAPGCNCSNSLAGHRLHKTTGFPTCFLNPLPESLCSPRGVCGVARCSATTIQGIHTPQCASNCHQRQPVMLLCYYKFCEEIGPWSSIPAKMNSLWSRWSSPKCNNTCGRGYMVAVTSCQDQRRACHRLHWAGIILVSQNISLEVTLNSLSMMKGVNFSSCPDSFGKCYCEVNTVDGIMRAARFTEPCVSTEGCTKSDAGTFTFEGEYDPSGSADFDQAYENDDSERFEDTLFYSESVRPSPRRLLRVHIANEEYELRENRSPNKNLKNTGRYRPNARGRLDEYTDYTEEEDDDDDGTGDDSNIGDEGDTDDVEDDEEDEEEVKTDSPQYYDYDSSGNRLYGLQTKFAMKLATLNILLWFIWS